MATSAAPGKAALVGAFVALLGATAVPAAHADPPGFPDLSRFSAVDTAAHVTHYVRGGSAVGFSTPDGVACSWPLAEDPDFHTTVQCSGDIPGIPATVPDTDRTGCAQLIQGGGLAGSTYLYTFVRRGGYSCPPFPATLAVGEKISASNITCAVGDGGVTACIDPLMNHGFVLQPSGSWVF